MKFSMYARLMELLNSDGIEGAAKNAKENGYSGVEFLYYANKPELIPSVEVAKEYKTVLDSFGLSVPCVSAVASIVTPEMPDVLSLSDCEGLMKAIDFSAAVGAKFFHHTLLLTLNPAHKAIVSYDSIFPLVLEGAKRVADYAASLGLTVLYEPQGFFFNGVEGVGRLYREIKKHCPNVALCGDVGNTYYAGEEPYALFEEFAGDIVHVHLKDYDILGDACSIADLVTTEGVRLKPALIGRGMIDIKRLLGTLKAAKYSGFMSIESAPSTASPSAIADVMKYVSENY